MRIREIMEEIGVATTGTGSIAPVVMPLGGVQRRMPVGMLTGVTTSDLTPNTPDEYKKYKRKK